ncbi:MAG TPA: glycosyltransferase family 2 protein [Candidatus Omnitrophota bacterium]|nr:glycosyltransferase family 2 protein [Candidatus Omnitrophota bacterium]HPT39228.1 glycosyltransferase family 2 protein [Candidatus Omnitrophota bacterium]
MAKISIVIITYNGANFILPCLAAIFKQKAADTELILVDNASRDNTVTLVKEKYPEVTILENKFNYGASKARNQGLAVAGGEWILTLDCDVVLGDDFLKAALEIIKTLSAKVGLIQPKILDIRSGRIYSAGIRMSFLERFHDIGRGKFDRGQFDVSGYIFGACCAAALYRRKMLDQIKDSYGYFDERFFFLFEDADLAWRGQKKGWFCLYTPELKCSHHGNSSSTDSKTRQYLSFINRQRMILKNQNRLITFLKSPLFLIYDLLRFLILAVKFKGKFPKIG